MLHALFFCSGASGLTAFRERGLTLPEGPRTREVIAKSPYLRGVIERSREVAPRRLAG
jgi:hypothetical protein